MTVRINTLVYRLAAQFAAVFPPWQWIGPFASRSWSSSSSKLCCPWPQPSPLEKLHPAPVSRHNMASFRASSCPCPIHWVRSKSSWASLTQRRPSASTASVRRAIRKSGQRPAWPTGTALLVRSGSLPTWPTKRKLWKWCPSRGANTSCTSNNCCWKIRARTASIWTSTLRSKVSPPIGLFLLARPRQKLLFLNDDSGFVDWFVNTMGVQSSNLLRRDTIPTFPGRLTHQPVQSKSHFNLELLDNGCARVVVFVHWKHLTPTFLPSL